MRFDQFWKELAIELEHNKKFKTWKQKKSFEANFADNDAVMATPNSTKLGRRIQIKEFREMWNIMKDDIRSERYIGAKQRYHRYLNSSYVSALIDSVVKDQDMQ